MFPRARGLPGEKLQRCGDWRDRASVFHGNYEKRKSVAADAKEDSSWRNCARGGRGWMTDRSVSFCFR